MLSRLNRDFARFAIALTALLASVGIAVAIDVQPAAASNTRCAWIAKWHLWGRTYPTASYCFSVNGSGLTVNNTISSYESPWAQNLAERIDAVDKQGSVYGSWWTYQANGNLYGTHSWNSGLRGRLRPGALCGRIFSNGTELGKVCISVYA